VFSRFINVNESRAARRFFAAKAKDRQVEPKPFDE